jgi:hypothetical protein
LRDPESRRIKNFWIPACAGMTLGHSLIYFVNFSSRTLAVMNRWEAIEISNRMRQNATVMHGTGGIEIEVNTKSPNDLNLHAA